MPAGQSRILSSGLLGLCLVLWIGLWFNDISLAKEEPRILRSPASAEARFFYSLGVLYSLDSNIDAAIREIGRAVNLDPDSDFLAQELATLYLRQGQKEKARDTCLDYLKRFPDNIPLRLKLGGILRLMDDREGALREYRQVLQLQPENTDALLRSGLLYFETGDFQSAAASYERVLSHDHRHLLASFHLARVHAAAKNLQAAEEWFKKSLTIEPSFEPAILELANLFERQQRTEDAVLMYLRYLEVYPDSMSVRLRLTEIYIRDHRFLEAEEQLKKAAEIDQEARDLFVVWAVLEYERGNYSGTYELLNKYLQRHPEDQRMRYLFAAAAARLMRYDVALEEYSKITPDSEMFANARIRMAMIFERKNQPDKAIEILIGALEQRKNPILYWYLSSLYEKAKDIENAEKTLKRGIIEFPESVDLRYSLGILFEKSGRFDLGIEQMKIILKSDPDNAEAMNFIGYSWADRGINLDEAEKLIRRALELQPGSYHIIDSMGWVYFKQGKNDRAIQYLYKAHKGMPDDPIIAEHLGDALKKAGRFLEALEVYRRGLKANPDNAGLKQKIADTLERL